MDLFLHFEYKNQIQVIDIVYPVFEHFSHVNKSLLHT